MVSWWVNPYGNHPFSQGTASTLGHPFGATTSTIATTSPTIWWSQTGAATTTITTSTWSSTSATTSSFYQNQMRALALMQMQSAAPYINQDELARRLYGMQMFNQPAPRREERQIMAAPAILRAREAPVAQRARDLLLSFLSDEQRRTYEGHGWFIVVGGRSGRRYRINGGTYAGNVDLLAANDNNKVEARFCGHCDASIPLGDQLLAQKVMLEVDEPAYIALANRRAA